MAKILEFKFVNCQSWKSPKIIKFTGGLNVILAENGTGKSVIFKALRFLLTPYLFDKDDRTDFITYNTEFAEFTVLFDTNEIVIMRIFPKQILYFYASDLNNPKFKQTVDMPCEEVFRAMMAIIEPETGYMMNIIDSDRSLFLIDSNDTTNVNSLRYIIEHAGVKKLLSFIEDRLPLLEQSQEQVYSKKLDWESQLHQLGTTNIIELEQNVNEAELFMELFEVLGDVWQTLEDIIIPEHEFKEYEEAVETLDNFINLINSGIFEVAIDLIGDNISPVDELLSALIVDLASSGILTESIREQAFIPDSYVDLVDLSYSLQEFIKEIEFDYTPLANAEECLEYVEILDNLKFSYNNLNVIGKTNEDLTQSKINIANLTELESYMLMLIEFESALNELTEICTIQAKTTDKVKRLMEELDNLRDTNEVLACPVYGEIIHKEGKCIPVLKSSANIKIVGGNMSE